MALAASTTVAGCAFGVGSGGDEGTVRVFSARTYGQEAAFERFVEDTGIEVEFLNGGDAELRERLEAEGEDTQADVYLTVDAANLRIAADEGLLRPLSSSTLRQAVPAELRDPDGRWFGLALRSRTFVYHPDRVDPEELTTYEALAEPQWRDRVCMRGATSPYTQSLVASLVAHHGEEGALRIVRGWVDNGVEIINNDVEILDTVAEGGCDVGLTNHYYLAREQAEDPDFPVRLAWANQDTTGAHVNISGGGVTRHADSPEAARRFLEWLATRGQRSFVEESKEYPVNPDTALSPVLREFGDFRRDSLNVGRLGPLNDDAVRLMREAGYS